MFANPSSDHFSHTSQNPSSQIELAHEGFTALVARIFREEKVRPAKGKPELPRGFEKYLRIGSIKAKIIRVGDWSAKPLKAPEIGEEVSHTVTLNVGEKHGVFPTMRFNIDKPRHFSGMRVTVTKVSQNNCEAVVKLWRGNPAETGSPATTAWELSTP